MRGNAPEAEALKRRHYQWLLETGQEEEAGRVKERDGDFVGAINLFMQGGLPARAAQVLRVYCSHIHEEHERGLIPDCRQHHRQHRARGLVLLRPYRCTAHKVCVHEQHDRGVIL